MQRLQTFFNNDRRVMPFLFAASLFVYSFYLYPVFLNLNSTLSSITLDSVKNYYTFVYNIRHNSFNFEFRGMNYPFGEHVVYTDCQPLLGFILKLVPPLYPYSIGILHSLLFLSFIVTPLILFRIFRIWKVPTIAACLFAIGIALLSPQFQKINGGHHALAYGCIFPYSILLLLEVYYNHSINKILKLSLFNTLIFFIHPYLGFCLCLFSFLTLLIFTLVTASRKKLRSYAEVISGGLLPAAVFKIVMVLTDKHADRPIEPFGSEVLVENMGSLLVPEFGPFQDRFTQLFPAPTQHFEGHSYLGAGTLLFIVLFLFCVPFLIKRKLFSREVLALFISALLILFFSFGWHHDLLRMMKINIPELKQFRAVSRFAYVFYFCLPLVLVVLVHRLINSVKRPLITLVLAILFFALNLWEASYYLTLNKAAYWRFPNFFNETYLNNQDKRGLEYVKSSRSQALLPLPLFHGGSEMYDRIGSSNAMIPSMLYSYHSGLPIISMMGSRTSISETEELIGILNSYKKNKPIRKKFNDENIVVIRTSEKLLPDESRLAQKVYFESPQDSITLGKISVTKLFESKISKQVVDLSDSLVAKQQAIIFIQSADRKPFTVTSMNDYEKILTLPAGQLPSGKYVLSFHYHYPQKIYSWLSTNLIIAEGENENFRWVHNIPVRTLSGFYSGFGVFECFIEIKPSTRLELILKGLEDKSYHISHFLLRPENTSTTFKQGPFTLLNNFPD